MELTSLGSSMSRAVTFSRTWACESPCFVSSATYSLLYSGPDSAAASTGRRSSRT